MIIAQISDTHIARDHPQGADRIGDLKRCIADINRLVPQPDVVVHSGDVTHQGQADDYRVARDLLGELRAPLHVVAGNRDERGLLRAALCQDGRLAPDWPFVQYAVDDYPVRLIVLDSLSGTSKKGDLCQRRLDHLGARLAEGGEKPVAIFMHHPPFHIAVLPDPFQFEAPAAAERLAAVLAESGREVRIFCGHAHRITEGQVGPAPASTTTAVARDLRKGDYPEAAAGKPLYQLHSYQAGRGFTTETRAAR